ncbi:class I SAM-dependent methyltransferase [Skermania sp. ID1734]|uniref:class I SAM-dependent methyltransferase n=1 Tax=Skermania sp. ID1734 TaxID=2597516 RepID=UPI00117D27A6|nr:class I SAM-dependent methyltransferase [Skermania sp. ID1734]TSD93135.1 class I SAM-dependent methyltransferase [Skermania sp. ID1734]
MASKYSCVVDVSAPNTSHSIAVRMLGANQRVLELGAAAGDVTRVLVERGCDVTAVEYDPDNRADLEAVAQQVIIGDLNDPDLLDSLTGQFDAVLAGDVLEHLIDPDAVLRRVARLLAPGGQVVISLPNIAHIDVRLSLLQGRFDYRPTGLLDRTHLRFFTRKTVDELVDGAGLTIIEMRKVRVPAFYTEFQVDRNSVPQSLVEEILKDPDAETYQFVFTAVRKNGDLSTQQLAQRYTELLENYDRLIEQHALAQHKLALLEASGILRYTAKPRRVYHRLRDAVSGK